MQFSKISIAAFAALPTVISAFSLGTISNPIGDVNPKCASQFNIPLMSCGFLPGKCSEACVEQLENLSKTLQNVCKDVEEPKGLLSTAMQGQLVGMLCTSSSSSSSSSSNNNNNEDEPSRVSAPASQTPTVGPGKSTQPTPANADLEMSGIIAATSATAAEPTATELVIDTSVPDATQDVETPEATTYLPSTLRTSTSSPTSTQSSNSNDNGGLFTSQEDMPSSAAAIRAGLLGLAAGFVAVIVNIA